MLLAGLLTLASSPAGAEMLQDALAQAYRSNPALRGQQASQRAIAETAVQAHTGWRPVVTATIDAGYQRGPYSYDFAAGAIETNDVEANLTLKQPIYTGGRVANAVRAADARVRAGEQGVRLVEAQILQSVALAYMDVVRDQDIVYVRRADLVTLQRQVAETRSRFDLGDRITRTDVAQAEAQRQQAIAALAAAEAQRDTSRTNYRTAVGTLPGTLVQPASLPNLPVSLDQVLALAEIANPALAQSRLTAQASRADVATARAAWFPSIGVQASVGAIGPAMPFRQRDYGRETTALVTLTQPLVSGGLIASQVRQARDRNDSDRDAAETAERQAEQAAATAWSQMRAGIIAIHADDAQVEAAATALKGAQLEYGYGLRSTLDVLIADETLRAAQVSLAQSRHDTIVAEAALLAATGRLEAHLLLAQEAP